MTEMKMPFQHLYVKDHFLAMLAVAIATAIAIPLELILHSTNLVLVYVLSVIVTGLKYGSWPAVTASLLSFASFNYFMTEPRYTLHVIREDEISTLLFLLLIALICGPVASRIRLQLILLREANRTSEAMRLLGQELSVADDQESVWRSVEKGITSSLDVSCHIMLPAESGSNSTIDHKDRSLELNLELHPIFKDNRQIAVAAIQAASTHPLRGSDTALIKAMLHQGADSWRRIELARELESARIKAEIEQLRSALLSSVSHDLKSPLSAMMGAAESLHLLDKQLKTEDRQELVETIVQESQRLDSYIQNLLDMTRLGHGDLKIERDWASVDDIIGSALARLRRYFPSVQYDYKSVASLSLVYVHAALVEQALFNIFENAAKFSPPDEPILVTTHQEGERCFIITEDKGPGVPKAQREQIFDMFYVIADGDRKRQNSGMGLAICRGMIAAHGGSVIATDTADGQGTRFVVELPVEYPEASELNGFETE